MDTSDRIFLAVADPTRRAILATLRNGSRSVRVLAAPFDMSRPAVSKHLRVLREAGLVHEVRHGRERHYRLRPLRLRVIDHWLEQYRQFWTVSLTRLKAHVERAAVREAKRIR